MAHRMQSAPRLMHDRFELGSVSGSVSINPTLNCPLQHLDAPIGLNSGHQLAADEPSTSMMQQPVSGTGRPLPWFAPLVHVRPWPIAYMVNISDKLLSISQSHYSFRDRAPNMLLVIEAPEPRSGAMKEADRAGAFAAACSAASST